MTSISIDAAAVVATGPPPRLGHASISTTLNIYTHAVDASHRKAIEAVERELFVVLDHSGLQTATLQENALRPQ